MKMLFAMLRSWFGCALTVALIAGVSACGGHRGGPTLPNGQRLAIMVFVDRGVAEGTEPGKVQQLQQVNDWLEPDLLAVLRDSGYEAASVASVDGAGGPAPGRYALRVRITDYNAGSKAARMFIGWGAGKARLAAQFELIGPNGTSYIAGEPEAATGRTDWKHAVRKVDQEIVAAVNVRLNQGL